MDASGEEILRKEVLFHSIGLHIRSVSPLLIPATGNAIAYGGKICSHCLETLSWSDSGAVEEPNGVAKEYGFLTDGENNRRRYWIQPPLPTLTTASDLFGYKMGYRVVLH